MADTKISGLTALTGANAVSGDLLTIVDISDTTMAATGTNKKITLTELQGAPVSAGTANGVLYLNGSKVATSGSALVFDGTNLGVGTANTIAKLTVDGGAHIRNYTAPDTSYASLVLGITGGEAYIQPYTTGLAQIPMNLEGSTVKFNAGGSEGMRLTSTGLGIGTTSPSARLAVAGSTGTIATFTNGATADFSIICGSSITNLNAGGANIMAFQTGGTERARIDSSGNLLVGTTSGSTNIVYRTDNSNPILIARNGSASGTIFGVTVNYSGQAPNNTTSFFLQCNDTGAERATIRSNGGIANYQANDVNLSDRREKTNFAPAKAYLETICSIPVQTFNYIDQNNEEDPGTTLGVIAQDVQAVAPELVSESNWGSEDNPKMRLSIYQTDLQYALMKALQELKAEFDAYKASHP